MINFKEETQKGECLKPMEFSLLVKLRYCDFGDGGGGVFGSTCLHTSDHTCFTHERLNLVFI